jgi:hypothetical protein
MSETNEQKIARLKAEIKAWDGKNVYLYKAARNELNALESAQVQPKAKPEVTKNAVIPSTSKPTKKK